ncbi:hypothetical protein WR25_02558 [Diploscapter pachys]|uniref:26S proteasome non-ATPase regulatory subunit 4 n=1 Tax=Diploscapter pachys TaxID=2018661 RepID=A0A2A2KUS6_9BILA|nr:hypothetical protein WR25_02558 [Diploscapter pachys]
MVQESTMICVDSSEYMRNGDFVPNRLVSLQDAAQLVIQAKLRGNPENAVGLLAMNGGIDVLCSMTSENNKLQSKLNSLAPKGACNFLSAIKTAHLALKNRQNRNHRMRIVLFCGSPLDEINLEELVKLAKKLRKEKVFVDCVCFGEAGGENSQKMADFIDALNGKDNSGSNLIVVPAGTSLREVLATSAVCRGEDGNVIGGGAAGAAGFEFGIDPEEDPDLALALRVSMEEERARQAALAAQNAQAQAGGEGGNGAAAGQAAVQPDAGQRQQQPGAGSEQMDVDMQHMTEEEQLEWALRMSMQNDVETAAEPTNATTPATGQAHTATSGGGQDDLDSLMNDPELLQELVNQVPSSNQGNSNNEKGSEEKKKGGHLFESRMAKRRSATIPEDVRPTSSDSEANDEDEDAPMEVTSKITNSDIPLLEDEEPEESLYEQVKAKKSNEAQQKKEAKMAKRRLKRKVRKLKKGQFEVQTRNARFKVVTLDGVRNSLQPEKNFRAELLAARTANRRITKESVNCSEKRRNWLKKGK